MAVYPNIKFYRRAEAPSNPQEGYIWFDVTNKRLKIYKSNDWEDYSGKLVDASFASNTLTITKQDGTTVSVDLSGLTTVDSRISTAINGLDATVGSTSFSQNTNSAVTTAHVAVQVVEANGKLTKVTVAEKDIASASALSTLDGKVTTLIGSDSSKSVRKIANEELAKVLLADGDDKYGAEKNFATLQELAAWIEQHPEDAAAMNETINSIKNSYVSSLTDSATYIELNNTKGSITLTDTALQTKIAGLEQAINNAAAAGVTSFGTKTGAITIRGGQNANGSVNLTMSNNQLQASIVGLGSAAYTASTAYATAAQGALASSALQKNDIISGTNNGTISVKGTNIAVKGLGSAAYTASTAYATAAQGGKADTALQAENIASGSANGTISVKGTDVSVTGLGSAAYTASTAYATAAQGTLATNALQKISTSSAYLTIGNKSKDANDGNKYHQSINPVMGVFGGANGLATTSNTAAYVNTYVDAVFSWAEY